MFFNSIEFAIFLPLVFLVYWFCFKNKLKNQNMYLLIVSYLFYGWWDWRFLGLIAFSSFVDFVVGNKIDKTNATKERKLLLLVSVLVNLGFLGFFKYYNFFAESFAEAFTVFGSQISVSRLEIILPVGISFYTFQTMSYTIDVYRGKIKPTNDPMAFFAFVSFFPQLVAGPIERASHLLPQFENKRVFSYGRSIEGLQQILWGMFKKVVIADNCAEYVNYAFDNIESSSGSTLALGAIFFSFQIYGDFSGYSDIAIGTGKLFGFDLMTNFKYPYFSRDIAEFWRRWHISLSTWFRDYVYIPLGGSRGSLMRVIRNTVIIFAVSGLWHGANWTFLLWGLLHAVYFLPLLLTKRNRINVHEISPNNHLPKFKEIIKISTTFSLVTIAWIFFRADGIGSAFLYIDYLFSESLFRIPEIQSQELITILMIILMMSIEWLQRNRKFGLDISSAVHPRIFRWAIYLTVTMFIAMFHGAGQEFIYFQF